MTKNLNDPKKFWKVVKLKTDFVSANELPSFLSKDGAKLTEESKMLRFFNEHFISAGCLFDSLSAGKSGTKLSAGSEIPFGGECLAHCSFKFSSLSIGEVLSELKSLDRNKAAGPDHLEPFFLKLAADHVAEPLTHIFNLSLKSAKIPKVWKSAFVLLLLKGGDPTEVNNYRPISKRCIVAKILEKLISIQLKDFLEANNILCNFQSGFRKKLSTITAALQVLNDFLQALNLKKYCAALFIDLSKAFDTVDSELLIKILEQYALGRALDWFAIIYHIVLRMSNCQEPLLLSWA